MRKKSSEPVSAHEKIEQRLRAYSLVRPRPEFRRELLSGASDQAKFPWSELALRWALAIMVLTLTWAQWNERAVTKRMIRLERSAVVRRGFPVVGEELIGMDVVKDWPKDPIFYAIIRAPLPPGLGTNRVPFYIGSLSQVRGGSS